MNTGIYILSAEPG